MADEFILHPFNKIDEPDWIALHTKGKIQREAGHRGFQDMELRADGRSFLRVTMELVELELRYHMAASPHVGALLLTPAKPVSAQALAFPPSQPVHTPNAAFRALEASVRKDSISLKAHLLFRDDGIMKTLASPAMSAEDALAILKDWLVYLQAPDTTGWRLTRDTDILFPSRAVTARKQQLVLVKDTTQRFLSFSRKDVQSAAADLINGQLQSIEITYMENALWIQGTALKAQGEYFTVKATHPDFAGTIFTAQMPDEEACMWLSEYPCGGFLPEGKRWR